MTVDPDLVTLETFLAQGVQEILKNVHTMLPGQVQEFDADTQRVKVQIVCVRLMEDGTTLDYPVLIEVPVMVYRFGPFAVTTPPTAGDTVAVFFSERSMSYWLAHGKTGQPPTERRFFDLADGFAVPGIFPKTDTLSDFATDAIEIRNEDRSVRIRLTEAGEIEITNGTTTVTVDGASVSIDNGTVEVVQTVSSLLQQLSVETVIIPSGSSAGTYSLTGAAQYAAFKALWDTLL
jgi:hypothetical protein